MTWTLVTALAAVPYIVEVLSQLPLLTRVMAALPPGVRARLPPHPRRNSLAVFGSTRFFLALFRFALRDESDDGTELARLKGKMRASALREALFGTALIVVVVVAWRQGWRPSFPAPGP